MNAEDIDYKQWRREVWEVTNHEKLKLAPVFELDSIEIKLRRMITEYGNTRQYYRLLILELL